MPKTVTLALVHAAAILSAGALTCSAGMVSHDFGSTAGSDRPADAFVLAARRPLSVASAPAATRANAELFRAGARSRAAYCRIAPNARQLAAARSIRVMPPHTDGRHGPAMTAAVPSPTLVALLIAAVAGVFATRPHRVTGRR